MENSKLNIVSGIYYKRDTNEKVDVIDFNTKERGKRSTLDWVTYIDSENKEHIRENLNIQLDFKYGGNSMFDKILNTPSLPSIKNARIYETAKELLLKKDCTVASAISTAKELVEEIGIEYV